MVDLLARLIKAHKVLAAAGEKRFGEEGKTLGGSWARPELAEAVHRGTVEVRGEAASIRSDPQHIFLRLKLADGKWRVDLIHSMDPEVRVQKSLFERSVQAAEKTSEDIARGKVKDLDEARELLRRYGEPPETQPTTKP